MYWAALVCRITDGILLSEQQPGLLHQQVHLKQQPALLRIPAGECGTEPIAAANAAAWRAKVAERLHYAQRMQDLLEVGYISC